MAEEIFIPKILATPLDVTDTAHPDRIDERTTTAATRLDQNWPHVSPANPRTLGNFFHYPRSYIQSAWKKAAGKGKFLFKCKKARMHAFDTQSLISGEGRRSSARKSLASRPTATGPPSPSPLRIVVLGPFKVISFSLRARNNPSCFNMTRSWKKSKPMFWWNIRHKYTRTASRN